MPLVYGFGQSVTCHIDKVYTHKYAHTHILTHTLVYGFGQSVTCHIDRVYVSVTLEY